MLMTARHWATASTVWKCRDTGDINTQLPASFNCSHSMLRREICPLQGPIHKIYCANDSTNTALKFCMGLQFALFACDANIHFPSWNSAFAPRTQQADQWQREKEKDHSDHELQLMGDMVLRQQLPAWDLLCQCVSINALQSQPTFTATYW